MVSDELGQHLHDLATRGKTLSAEEQAQLSKWYDQQDRAEMTMLEQSAPSQDQTYLQTEINKVLHQIGNASKQIQEIAQQNEGLRQEVARFRRQLAQTTVPQVA